MTCFSHDINVTYRRQGFIDKKIINIYCLKQMTAIHVSTKLDPEGYRAVLKTFLSKNSLTVMESHSLAFGASQGASIGICSKKRKKI
jgi:hypothetical protein